ncbi:MAG: ABC transporter ATP-binding protein [Oscillospiraceae bacterium]|nr:ABC transporter ATP-binding protein [Oscillospiraceae bacterium]
MPDKIEIQNLSRSYSKKGGKSERFYALKDFSLTVRQGEFVTIVGPSGCGKSTLLDLLIGLAKPDEGRVLIDGKPIGGPSLDRGIVLQGYALFPWRTVRGNIEFGLEVKGIPKASRREMSDYYIKLVDLVGFENHYPYELSGGMQQRTAIARILAYDPAILMMDEPFAAVDAQTREVMQDELLSIWEKTGKTVIFVTHSIEEAVGLADRVAVMSRSPGQVKEIVDINLPRPRRVGTIRNTPEFVALFHRVWELLRNAEQSGGKDDGGIAGVSGRIHPAAVI